MDSFIKFKDNSKEGILNLLKFSQIIFIYMRE